MDLIVMGSPVFYYDVPGYVKNYIRSWPDLNRTPVAAYVTFGGPEGNQHNAAATQHQNPCRQCRLGGDNATLGNTDNRRQRPGDECDHNRDVFIHDPPQMSPS